MLFEFRYLLMRVVRLILTVLSECVMMLSVVPFGVTLVIAPMTLVFGIFGVMTGVNSVTMGHLIEYFGILIASGIVLFGSMTLVVAFGSPYRYNSSMPGVMVHKCRQCGSMTPDFARCTSCQSVRVEYGGSLVMRMLNHVVTAMWIVHDTILGMLGIML